MKKYILAAVLVTAVATTIHLSLKKTNINADELMAAAVARPEVTVKTPADIEKEMEMDRQSYMEDMGFIGNCIKKTACDYVGDEAAKKGAKQGMFCTYQTYLAKINPDKKRMDDINKVRYPTKPELQNVDFCKEGEKFCYPLYEMQVIDQYKGPEYKTVERVSSVHKIIGYVKKADLAKYDGSKACNWKADRELENEGPEGALIKTLKTFENGQDTTNKSLGGPNSKDKAVNNRK